MKYHLPFSGDPQVLGCAPNPRVPNSYPVTVEGAEVCFEIIDFSGNAESIKREAEQVLGLIRQQSANLEKNITIHNGQLRQHTETVFDARKAQTMTQNQVVAALGVPVKKVADIPKTFAVPAVSRKPVVPKPQAPSERYSPEPTLDQGIYEEILQTIFDTGRRVRAVTEHVCRQGRRDATRSSDSEPRTPLPDRHDRGDVQQIRQDRYFDASRRQEHLRAECKFWRGQKAHHETIDQLLSYLTWRDSKTAIVYFLDTKEMAAPLKAIEEATPQHSCFVAAKGKRHESLLSYEFHLPGDHSRPCRSRFFAFTYRNRPTLRLRRPALTLPAGHYSVLNLSSTLSFVSTYD